MTMMMSVGVLITSYLDGQAQDAGEKGESQGTKAYSLMMCGCRSILRYSISRVTRVFIFMAMMRALLMNFMATFACVTVCTATVERINEMMYIFP